MDDAQVAEKVKMLAFRKEYLKGIVMVNLLDDVMVTQSVYMQDLYRVEKKVEQMVVFGVEKLAHLMVMLLDHNQESKSGLYSVEQRGKMWAKCAVEYWDIEMANMKVEQMVYKKAFDWGYQQVGRSGFQTEMNVAVSWEM